MAKQIETEKVKTIYEKGDLSQMIEAHYQIGQWLHDKIDARQKELAKESEDLQPHKNIMKTK